MTEPKLAVCITCMQHHTGQFMQKYETCKADVVRLPETILFETRLWSA